MKRLLSSYFNILAIGFVVLVVLVLGRDKFSCNQNRRSSTDLDREADAIAERIAKNSQKTQNAFDRITGVITGQKPKRSTSPPPTTSGGRKEISLPNVGGDKNKNNQNNKATTTTTIDEPEVVEDVAQEEYNDPPETVIEDNFDESESNGSVDEIPTLNPTSNKMLSRRPESYRIQLSLLSGNNNNFSRFKPIADLGNIYSEFTEDGQKKVFLGDFFDKVDADLVLKAVKVRGFSDVFLVSKNLINEEFYEEEMEELADNLSPESYTTKKPAFLIRLGIFDNPRFNSLGSLQELGAIYMQPNSDGSFTIFMGDFQQQSDAEPVLKKIQTKGYKDAFVTSFKSVDNGKGLLQMRESTTVTHRGKSSSDAILPTVKRSGGNSATTAKDNGNVAKGYVIQLSAAQSPQYKRFKTLQTCGHIYEEYVPKQDVTKVFLGTYPNRTKAESILERVKKQGFSNAFIRKIATNNENSTDRNIIFHKIK